MYCTSRRATVVVVVLSLGALTAETIRCIVQYAYFPAFTYTLVRDIYTIVFLVAAPVTVFIVNMIVMREVRRASNSAAVNLGLQQHHQSTSSNSAVPTVMLITTSLIYVLLTAPSGLFYVLFMKMPDSVWCSKTWKTLLVVAMELYRVIFAYNFFVYIITSKQFRGELRRLCSSSCSSAANNEPAAQQQVRY